MTLRPLHVYPWPMEEARLELLKQAKAMIDTEERILPVEAIPGSPGRVLAFGQAPPWVCVSALIKPLNVGSVDSIRSALEALLFDDRDDRMRDEADCLSDFMGVPVRYLHSEDADGKVFWE